MPARVIAGILALVAFAVAVLAGVAASNPAPKLFGRALAAMVVFYFVGLIVGAMAHRAVTEDIESYKAAHPIQQADEPPEVAHVAGDTGDGANASGGGGSTGSARSQAA